MIEWNKQLKIAVRESREAQYKHLLVKSLIVLAIRLKYSRDLKYQLIYTEFDLNGAIPDVYHENSKTKEVICYEIQEQISEDYIKEKTKFYQNYIPTYFNSVDWKLINLKECPQKIEDCWNWVKEQVI